MTNQQKGVAHGAALVDRVLLISYLVVIDNPVWQGLFLLGSTVGWAASVCGRIVVTTPVHISQSRWDTRVLDSHLWCLVSIALDISQGLLLVESMVVQGDLHTGTTSSLLASRQLGGAGVVCQCHKQVAEDDGLLEQCAWTQDGNKIPQIQRM